MFIPPPPPDPERLTKYRFTTVVQIITISATAAHRRSKQVGGIADSELEQTTMTMMMMMMMMMMMTMMMTYTSSTFYNQHHEAQSPQPPARPLVSRGRASTASWPRGGLGRWPPRPGRTRAGLRGLGLECLSEL